MARLRNWAPQSKRLDRPGREQPPGAGAEARQLDPLRAVVDAAVPELEAVPPIGVGIGEDRVDTNTISLPAGRAPGSWSIFRI